ncbi:MAG: HTH17 domain-containing protein [Nitrospira sp.]|nr:MAG: HTH17 domain-containing protein [Nitrospira sp.]
MTILTIAEAAVFLRLSRRTMYTLKDIPRVRYAGKLVYVLEDLEAWVRSRQEGAAGNLTSVKTSANSERLPRIRRRRAIFVLPKESQSK